jgi:ferric-dicitrate binding protein FerR (iron transport regulator)
MSAPRYARLASKALAQIDPGPPPPPAAEDRSSAIAAVAGQIALRARKRRWRRGIAVALAAAAVVATLGASRVLFRHATEVAVAPPPPQPTIAAQVMVHPLGVGSQVVASGAERPLDADRALPAGSRVVTPANGRAMLSFASGTAVMLREGADLTVASEGASQLLRLDTGSVELHVAKLAAGERFLVDTSDSQVEVRGTKFRVSIVDPEMACGAGTRTRVAVTEGVVVVRHDGHEERVSAGEQWPGGCAAPAQPAAMPSPTRTPTPLTAAASAGSTLAEQNDLFASAFTAKRQGDVRAELAALDRFLATYPSSALAENAIVERMRVMRATAPERASAAARDYVTRYPNGFARAEAEAILAEAP